MTDHIDDVVAVVSDDGAHIDVAVVHHNKWVPKPLAPEPTGNLEFVDA